MELLETQDPEKKKLIEASDRHKKELLREVKDMSDKTEQVVKNALIIGGTLAVTYLLVSQVRSSKKKKAKVKAKGVQNSEPDLEPTPVYSPPSFLSQLGDRLVNQATLLLLDVAKEKLSEYLSNRKQKHEDS
ncbi:MAG: hypothetical protein DYG99_09735 [Bacteroidetes bacterium CHB5]|nr:hypothetical protein [Bacteroidetes bacterium CHB5]